MKLCIIEKIAQVKVVLNTQDVGKLTLLSLSPDVSYELYSRGLTFFEATDFLEHRKLWNQYSEIVKATLDLSRKLDDCIAGLEKSKGSSNDFFRNHHYILKVNYDQLHLYATLISCIQKKHTIIEFICFDQEGLELDEYGFIRPDINLFTLLLKENSKNKNFKINFLEESKEVKMKKEASFSFGQPVKKITKMRWISFLLEKIHLIAKGGNVVLSVGSKDLNSMASEINETKKYSVTKFCRSNYFYGNGSKKNIECFENEKGIFVDDINISQLMTEIAEIFSKRISSYYGEMKSVNNYLDKLQPAAVVFQSLAPLYEYNPLILNWCKANDVPYTCWMHGGYGGNFSLPGYDVTDYALSKYQLVYGLANKDVVSDSRCVLNRLGIKQRDMHQIGAHYFYSLYKDSKANKSIKKDSFKKTITYFLGALTEKNQFYYGYDRTSAYYSIWKEHYEVIKVLVKFQDKYNIVIKDYPTQLYKSMWKKMLNDLNGENILYISSEKAFKKVLEDSDLNILPWVSTTFHQALYIDRADIFLFETGDITPSAEEVFSGEIFFSKNIKEFCAGIESYLHEGIFYKNPKNKCREYFLNWSRNKYMGVDFIRYLDSIV